MTDAVQERASDALEARLEQLRVENHLLKETIRQFTGWYVNWDEKGRMFAVRDHKLTATEQRAKALRRVEADTVTQLVTNIRGEHAKVVTTATSCTR